MFPISMLKIYPLKLYVLGLDLCPEFSIHGADFIFRGAEIFSLVEKILTPQNKILPPEHNKQKGGGAKYIIITKDILVLDSAPMPPMPP